MTHEFYDHVARHHLMILQVTYLIVIASKSIFDDLAVVENIEKYSTRLSKNPFKILHHMITKHARSYA